MPLKSIYIASNTSVTGIPSSAASADIIINKLSNYYYDVTIIDTYGTTIWKSIGNGVLNVTGWYKFTGTVVS